VNLLPIREGKGQSAAHESDPELVSARKGNGHH
jgi:hypothetical protein